MGSSAGRNRLVTLTSALLAPFAAGLAMGGCAATEGEGGIAAMLAQGPRPEVAADPRNELERATIHWGKEFARDPKNPDSAVNYARNLKAMGEKDRAMAVLQQASIYNANSKPLASEYGRLALEADQVALAEKLLARAEDPTKPDPKLISAQGAAIAKQGRHKDAIPYVERALVLAPDNPAVLNNLGMAHALNGDAARAEDILRKASAQPAAAPRVRQNLALVLGLQGKFDEAGKVAGTDLAPDKVAASVAYLQKMVDHTPAAGKAQARADTGSAGSGARNGAGKVAAAKTSPAALVGSGGPVEAASAWSTEVARADDTVSGFGR